MQLMYRYGRLVLGSKNQITKDFMNVPDALSPEFRANRMEAICRQDKRIDVEDFRACTPPSNIVSNK